MWAQPAHLIMKWDQITIPVVFADDFLYQVRVVKDVMLVASFNHLKLTLFWFIKHQLGRATFRWYYFDMLVICQANHWFNVV